MTPAFAPPDTLIATIAANAGVSPGTYLETLTLTTTGGPHSVGITAIVR